MTHAIPAVLPSSKLLGLAAGLVLVAVVLGVALADQAPNMAATSTLTVYASSGSSSGIRVGHS
jgi:ABC-type transporter Mla subunit MlaD